MHIQEELEQQRQWIADRIKDVMARDEYQNLDIKDTLETLSQLVNSMNGADKLNLMHALKESQLELTLETLQELKPSLGLEPVHANMLSDIITHITDNRENNANDNMHLFNDIGATLINLSVEHRDNPNAFIQPVQENPIPGF